MNGWDECLCWLYLCKTSNRRCKCWNYTLCEQYNNFLGGKGDSSLFRSFFPPRWHSDEKKNEKKLAQTSRSEEKCYALKSETYKKDHYFPSCFIGEPFRFRLRRKWKKLWKVLIILLGLVHYYYSKSTNLEHYYQFGHITIQIVPQLSN